LHISTFLPKTISEDTISQTDSYHLITETLSVVNALSCFFTFPTWKNLQVPMIWALLCHSNKRISDIWRIMGLSHEKRFEKYHRIFSQAKWNSLAEGRILLWLLIALLPNDYPVLIVVDDTI
jgi:hypothetical protein